MTVRLCVLFRSITIWSTYLIFSECLSLWLKLPSTIGSVDKGFNSRIRLHHDRKCEYSISHELYWQELDLKELCFTFHNLTICLLNVMAKDWVNLFALFDGWKVVYFYLLKIYLMDHLRCVMLFIVYAFVYNNPGVCIIGYADMYALVYLHKFCREV